MTKKKLQQITEDWWALRMTCAALDEYHFLKVKILRGKNAGKLKVVEIRYPETTAANIRQMAAGLLKLADKISPAQKCKPRE